MLRPADSVCLYLPNRSTIPARACGTMRTVLTSRITTNRKSRTSRISTISAPMGFSSGVDAWYRMDVRRGSADFQDLHSGPRFDGRVLVVGLGRPDLTGQLDPPGLHAGDAFGDDALLADELVVAE